MRYTSFTLACIFYFALSCLSAQAMVGIRVLSGSSSIASSQESLPANVGKHRGLSGTTFGIVVERDITYHLSLRSGIQQTQRGLTLQQGTLPKLLGASLPLNYETQVRMNYLEVPLALKFSLPIAQDQVEIFGWGGATAGYATGGSIRSRSASSLHFQLATSKLDMVNYAFPRFHLGYSGGLGFALNLGETLQFRLEGEYNRSAQKKAMLNAESGEHAYQLLHFGAGMVFRL